jgi:hypothetical protein
MSCTRYRLAASRGMAPAEVVGSSLASAMRVRNDREVTLVAEVCNW